MEFDQDGSVYPRNKAMLSIVDGEQQKDVFSYLAEHFGGKTAYCFFIKEDYNTIYCMVDY